jgi:hypothetical protein
VADQAISGKVTSPFPSADHYCTQRVAPATYWATEGAFLGSLGAHNFYHLGKDPDRRKAVHT